jgi:transcriptional regulator with XRE-family HTH domain
MHAINITKTGIKKEHYIKALLILHGVKQMDLVEKFGVSQPYISQIVKGSRKPVKKQGRLVRQAIAEALGMKVEELWPDKAA